MSDIRNILKEIKKEMNYSNFENADSAEQRHLLRLAKHYDSLDAEDFENMDEEEMEQFEEFEQMLEDAERRKKHHGHHRQHGKHHGGHHGHHGKHHGHHSSRALAAVGGGGAFHKQPINQTPAKFGSPEFIHSKMLHSKGILAITVSRATNTITAPLPYILFGLNGLTSNFRSALSQFLPSGTTVTASSDQATGDMLLTYVNGSNTDIVRVSLSGSQISYMEFLQNTFTNFIATDFVKWVAPNDANLVAQQSQQINFGLISALGMANRNSIMPRSLSLTTDYQPYNVNLMIPMQKTTSDFSFIQNIMNTTTPNYTLGWDIYISERINLNAMQHGK